MPNTEIIGNGLIEFNLSSSLLESNSITGNGLIEFNLNNEHRQTEKIDGTGVIELDLLSQYFNVVRILMQWVTLLDIRFGNMVLHTLSIASDIRFAKEIKFNISSDIRFSDKSYEKTTLRPITDFHIKLDGIELIDVDLESCKISYKLGTSPSEATMTLARRHDKLDYTLEGIYSQITNENKIEIYDVTKKIFTGYIAQINADSKNDTVSISAQDNRYKLSRVSPIKIYYGYFPPEERVKILDEGYTIFENNSSALSYILSLAIGAGYISSCESDILGEVKIKLEGKETTNTYNNIIDEILKESITADWYLDENEILRFVKRGQGNIINLSLASLDSYRTIYNVILSDVVLTRQSSTYITGARVTHGKEFISKYFIDEASWGKPHWFPYTNHTFFCFQTVPGRFGTHEHYIGENVTNYGYLSTVMIIIPSWIVQSKIPDIFKDIPNTILGSGNTIKLLIYDNYGAQQTNSYYEERNLDDGSTWLYRITPTNYNFISYANDLANFEFSQNNKLLTTATVSLFLDAYLINNINFYSLINLDNTIEENIYKNNNEFPLNIESMELTLKDRIMTLNLTNYGGSFVKRTVSYDSCIINEASESKLYKKELAIIFSQGL